MRKLIERDYEDEDLVVCDNKDCDFHVKSTKDNQDTLILFLNVPCPQCGENLLTKEDFITYMRVTKLVDRINRSFGWLTLFMPKNRKYKKVTVHCHDGIKIKEV
jgi:hypothetical protein